jgi:hypothetical protein
MIERLLEILLPAWSFTVQLIEAYFDESGSDANSDVLCVAGYVFEKGSCAEMDSKWQAVLSNYKLPFFRMSACAHGTKPFDALTLDQRIEVEKEMIRLVKQYAAYGTAVTVEPKRFDAIMPKIPEIGSAYSFCAHSILVSVRLWADKNNYSGDIAYFFESGHRSQSQANAIMQGLFSIPRQMLAHRYASHTFADKKKVRPLQAADLLAWQWLTDHKRRLKGKNQRRKDCAALVENQKPPHHVLNVTDQQLEWHKNRILSKLYPNTFPGEVPPAPTATIPTVDTLDLLYDARAKAMAAKRN